MEIDKTAQLSNGKETDNKADRRTNGNISSVDEWSCR